MEQKSERRLIDALGFEKRDSEGAAPEAQHTGQRSGKRLRESLMGKDE